MRKWRHNYELFNEQILFSLENVCIYQLFYVILHSNYKKCKMNSSHKIHTRQLLAEQQSQQLPPQVVPSTRFMRWNKMLMSGAAYTMQTLPNWFAVYAVATYIIALVIVNSLYPAYATEWYFGLFGIVWVAGFFYLSVKFSKEWDEQRVRKKKVFEKRLFQTGLIIRIVYAVFIYFFYIHMTGQPYEFGTADSTGYVNTAVWFSKQFDAGTLFETVKDLAKTDLGDIGYPLFLFPFMHMFERDIAVLVVRIAHAFFGAYTAVIIYRITRRSMDETTARMAAIFCMVHPVLICYVGLTLKEVFMTWLLVLFVDMADRMMTSRKYTFEAMAPLVIVGLTLFMFRTVLGMVALLAVAFALVMIDSKIVSIGKKIIVGTVLAGVMLLAVSDNIIREVNKIRQTDIIGDQEHAMEKRYGSEKGGGVSGNAFANYAGAAVFAPLIFTIPFPTMVNIGFQEDMRLIHGGNWVRNVMSGFVILAMIMLLLSGDWRRYTLMVALLLGYLVVLVFSAFAHSLRFHIPVIPFEMVFAAYAITNLRKKHKTWYLVWCVFMIVTCVGWNWIKLKGRGL